MSSLNVPFFDLSRQHRELKVEIEAAVREVLDSGRFILGPAVEELERQIAATVQKKRAVGVSSGTDALLLALMSFGVGPGDAVLTTPFSFFATAGVIARLGAVPLLADIDPATFNLDPGEAEKAVEAYLNRDPGLYPLPSGNWFPDAEGRRPNAERLKVIMPVHLYGQAADLAAFNRLARTYGLDVVEDAAQAIGAQTPDAEGGVRFRDHLVCYSFYPTKNLGGVGDAGMVATDNSEFADKLKKLRVHGAAARYVHDLVGGNFRLDTLQAAVLLVKLGHLERWTRSRQRNAGVYDRLLAETGLPGRDLVIPPPAVYGSAAGVPGYHIYNQYVVRVQDREGLQAFLKDRGIGTEVYYPVPFHRQPCFAYLGYRPGDFPEAEKAAAEVLALPIFPELTREEQDYVVEKIAEYYQSA
jgi:dTDP-4-amino-4,6-dideoxygalactose transaminase